MEMIYEYPPYLTTRTGDPIPTWEPRTAAPVPSIQEQMGIDPISKLAAAIEKLAEALSKGKGQ
jgi:hypothetical protein